MEDAEGYRELARRYREWAAVSNTTEREQRLRIAGQLEELAKTAEQRAAQNKGRAAMSSTEKGGNPPQDAAGAPDKHDPEQA